MSITAKIQRLVDGIVVKTTGVTRTGYDVVVPGKGQQYALGVKLDVERARLVTQSYEETENEPVILKRAEALKKVLEDMTIYIKDDELLVGAMSDAHESIPFYPEVYWRWLSKSINTDLKYLVNDQELEEVNQILDYWKNKSAHGKEREVIPKDIAAYERWNGALFSTYDWDCLLPDYDWLMKVGLNGVIDIVEAKLRKLNTSDIYNLPIADYIEKREFYEASLISLRAVIAWANRYAKLAKEKAAVETNPQRKQELEKIAEMCSWVPANPPRTFQEALQSFVFCHLVCNFIEQPLVGLGIRLDQVMYPSYKADVEAGRITKEDAIELLESLWIKFMEVGFVQPPIWSGAGGAGLAWQNITVGGVTPEGDDATNELSYLIVESANEVRLQQPPIEFRYSCKAPGSFIDAGIDLAAAGFAQPAFFNDDVLIPLLMEEVGASIEDAREYGINNCMHYQIPGKAMFYRASTYYLCLPKMLELALSQGMDKFSGKQLGARTPDPLTFTSIDDIMKAYLEQVYFFAVKGQIIHDAGELVIEQRLPRPFASSLLKACVEEGQDCVKYHEYYRSPPMALGGVNVADSLAAIKKNVFEEKRVTMEELLDALKNDWEEKEELRQLMLQAPKFGNDNDYVDSIAQDVFYKTTQEVAKVKNRYGNPVHMDGTVAAAYYGFSSLTGATPDGRRAKQAYNDGTISPVQGQDTNGPTAVLKSVSKIDPLLTWNHLLNQKFMPQFLQGEYLDMFKSYLRTWHDLGIHHVQFNTQKLEDLLDAKEHPERHTDLIVRVCGYAACFIDLSSALQDEVIKRTAQSFAEH